MNDCMLTLGMHPGMGSCMWIALHRKDLELCSVVGNTSGSFDASYIMSLANDPACYIAAFAQLNGILMVCVFAAGHQGLPEV